MKSVCDADLCSSYSTWSSPMFLSGSLFEQEYCWSLTASPASVPTQPDSNCRGLKQEQSQGRSRAGSHS